jgi:hypothetical protein
MNMEPITLSESQELIRLEGQIEIGRKSWISAGRALIEIRDRKLFRAEHSDFWQYCEARWGWKRRNALYLIESCESYESLPEGVQNFAQSASTARELAKVKPSHLAEVLQKAVESGPVTAKSIRQAAAPESAIAENQPTPPDLGAQFVKACGLTSADEIVQDLKYNLEMAKDDINCILQKITSAEWDAEAIGQAALELRVTAGKLEKLKRKIEVSK